MHNRLLLFLLLFLLAPASPMAAPALTERDWMVNLVEIMGWSFGLPDQPTDADYRDLLAGVRHFRFEAEAVVAADAPGIRKNIASFGDYSGDGWLGSLAAPTATRLRFLLPRAGSYLLVAAVRQPGHRLRIADREFTADGGYTFSRVPLGRMELPAGEITVDLDLPVDGGIDYLELTAAPLPPIEPAGGWQPERPLTVGTMAETTVQLLGLLPLLPPADEHLTIEAETAAAGSLGKTDERFLGQPSGGVWLRAGGAPATLELTFELEKDGVYDLDLRAAGPGTTVEVNGRPVSVDFPPYLGQCRLGTFHLSPGTVKVGVSLPPRGGVDALFLSRRFDSEAAYRRLSGLLEESDPPSATGAEKVLALLARLGTP